ncbi:nuclear pore complex protein Nup160-like [Diadema antillarum]|uniref:nuclear pore complex protein Nup160-like n=1 Tax=Diadema antillarum TaxID=105358 RepID=UPI003A87ED58
MSLADGAKSNMALSSSLREILILRGESHRWKDLTINAGGSQGVLQDVNVAESAGGFAFKDSNKVNSVTANRFIYWCTSQNRVELVECSLNHNLHGNALRLNFQGSPIIPRVSIHETHAHIVVLVATFTTVHRLAFPHPNKLTKLESRQHGTPDLPSLFAEASVTDFRDPSNIHEIAQSGSQPHEFQACGSWLTAEGEAWFALAARSGSLVLVKMAPLGLRGITAQHEVRESSIMERLWTGLVPSAIRRGQDAVYLAQSVAVRPLGQDLMAFCVCRDHKLRIWSCKTLTCLLTSDLTSFLPEGLGGGEDQPILRHEVRLVQGSSSHSLTLGVFLAVADLSLFLILEQQWQDGQYRLHHVTTLHDVKGQTLVDFTLTASHLLAMWVLPDGGTVVKATCYSEPGQEGWQPTYLENDQLTDIQVSSSLDPREAYLDHIFKPGRFSVQTILKALHTYSRSTGTDVGSLMDVDFPDPAVLRQDASIVVETEIQQRVGGGEVSQGEYRQLVEQSMTRFLDCCVEYHQVANKPLGLFLDTNTSMPCLIKKNLVSLLQPAGIIEDLYLGGRSNFSFEELDIVMEDQDPTLLQDIQALQTCLRLLVSAVPAAEMVRFQDQLLQLERPVDLAQELVGKILTQQGMASQDFREKITQTLAQISDPVQVLRAILTFLDVAEGSPEDLLFDIDDLREGMGPAHHTLGSGLSAVCLAASVAKLSQLRLELLQSLLVLECLVPRLGSQLPWATERTETLVCEVIPETCNILQAYHSLVWASTCSSCPAQNKIVEFHLRQMAVLELSSHGPSGLIGQSHPSAVQSTGPASPTLVELFLQGIGGMCVRSILAKRGSRRQEGLQNWGKLYPAALRAVTQLIWPISANFLFPEFLMTKCQYTQLQGYVRLLSPWCEWNAASRQFLLGHSYLNTGESVKAVSCFQQAAQRVGAEDFLIRLLRTTDLQGEKLETLYHLKVIGLLEQFELRELVISLAKTALSAAEQGDPNVPTLWSKIFKYHLELGHNDEAYSAMTSNPDPERRRDCLRQFVVVLCDRKQMKQLCQYPYIDLHDEIVSIIESRARSVDLLAIDYYGLLFAFHTIRGNYRQAGSVMYEQATRLAQEVLGVESLKRQANCYLAAMNSLRLLHPENAWIIRLASNEAQGIKTEDMMGASPKRDYEGTALDEPAPRRKVDVLELSDLEREYQLTAARLKLANHQPDMAHVTGAMMSPEETVSFLVQSGLYDTAVDVCKTFRLPLTPVFEGLSHRCVKLSRNGATSETWRWLAANDVGSLNLGREPTAAELVWHLLQLYLERHDTVGNHVHYQTVIKKVLSLGFQLPQWLVNSYKKLDPGNLLLLYISFDLLEEAGNLAIEFIDALLGKGEEYFGLKDPLRSTAPSVWMPYQQMDHLLTALKETKNKPELIQLHTILHSRLSEYLRQVDSVSKEMTDIAVRKYRSTVS